MTATVWLAARDGVAHGRRRRETRTLCGQSQIGERFAWPERTRCDTCRRLALAADLTAVSTHVLTDPRAETSAPGRDSPDGRPSAGRGVASTEPNA